MSSEKNVLGTAPVGRLLFRLALPAVAAQLVNMLYNIVDRIFIGHMPVDGALALTGVGVCMPLIMIVSAFAALVSMGGAPRASLDLGRGDKENAERTMGNCFVLLLAIAAVLTAALLIWNEELLMAFGASENTIGYAVDYMNVYAIGTVFVQVTLGMNAFVTAQGFAKTGMFTVLIGAACNILLDPLFIYVFHMGVRGAALATILSQALSALWVLRFLNGKKTGLRLKKEYFRLSPRVILPCVALGCASFVMQASESVLFICFNASLQRYGGDTAVGAMTILSSVMQLICLPMHGIAQGAQPISGYNYGAKNPARVKKTFFLLLASCMTYGLLLWSAVMLFPETVAAIFTPKEELIAFTAWALRIYLLGMSVFGLQIACQMTFISLGRAGASIIVAVLRKFILLIPLIYILPELMEDKLLAVYLAEPVADFISVAFTAILFAFQFKKSLAAIRLPEGEERQ